jgi:hypothetical protein
MIKRLGLGVAVGCICALAACDLVAPVTPVLTPKSRLAAPVTPVVVAQATSEQSAALRSQLRAVQSSQLTNGLLRQDGGGPDTPFDADMLVRNFKRLAFFNEYFTPGVPQGVPGQLRRWDKPIRFEVQFGASVPTSQRREDRADVAAYAQRLSRLTNHPISMSGPANFYVLFVSEDDRAETIDALVGRLPGVRAKSLASLRNLSPDIYCAVATYSERAGSSVYNSAVAVIRAENPDLLRLSCIHEELAQAMGLANDSPEARPSIFNDDDEFALLTSHDERLLQMLYDPRLRAGMTLSQADPILRVIANELTLGPV